MKLNYKKASNKYKKAYKESISAINPPNEKLIYTSKREKTRNEREGTTSPKSCSFKWLNRFGMGRDGGKEKGGTGKGRNGGIGAVIFLKLAHASWVPLPCANHFFFYIGTWTCLRVSKIFFRQTKLIKN